MQRKLTLRDVSYNDGLVLPSTNLSATGRVFRYVKVELSYDRASVSPDIILKPGGKGCVLAGVPPRPVHGMST